MGAVKGRRWGYFSLSIICTHYWPGINQDCILVLLLSNHYTSSLVQAFTPHLTSALLYADYDVILSHSPMVLRRTFCAFAANCKEEHFAIAYEPHQKSSPSPSHRWQIEDHNTEQTKAFKCLGLVWQASGCWRAQTRHAASSTFVRFHVTKEASLIPAAIKAFQGKFVT